MHQSNNPVRTRKNSRKLKTGIIVLAGVMLLTGITSFSFLKMSQFGKAPSGRRLERIKQSPHYKNGKFQNQHATPLFAPGYNMGKAVYEVIIKHNPRKTPVEVIPSQQTDLRGLSPERNVLIWFGHSSYFFQIDGKRFLVDPVFSGNASSVPGTSPSFEGSDVYSAKDMPEIDYLLISHDHYDHLDYKTIIALKSKVKKVICGLGVGEHFDYWGYDTGRISELDWGETLSLGDGFTIHAAQARHGSGRSLASNNTLWLSFILEAPSQKLFLGGDSGYDTHFAQIGQQYGPFDLAVLENGQYDLAIPYIHIQPEETIKAAIELGAKRLLPVHSSKFILNRHPWDEPLSRVSELAKNKPFTLATPMIGQIVDLNDNKQSFSHWWEGLN